MKIARFRDLLSFFRMLLTSQELAMQEYLTRQKKQAEKHMRKSPASARRHHLTNINTIPAVRQTDRPIMSMPGTPTAFRHVCQYD